MYAVVVNQKDRGHPTALRVVAHLSLSAIKISLPITPVGYLGFTDSQFIPYFHNDLMRGDIVNSPL